MNQANAHAAAAPSGERLTEVERSRLADLEAVVHRGLETFLEVGTALREIHDSRLYRETHRTFQAYLAERWSLSRSRGYRLMDAAAVAAVVSPVGDIPDNEAQARELVPLLRRDQQAALEVWGELRERYGKAVTADRVRTAVSTWIGGRAPRAPRRPFSPRHPSPDARLAHLNLDYNAYLASAATDEQAIWLAFGLVASRVDAARASGVRLHPIFRDRMLARLDETRQLILSLPTTDAPAPEPARPAEPEQPASPDDVGGAA